MKRFVQFLFFLLLVQAAGAQRKTEHLVIVTLDGMRWQEVFKGIDPELLNDPAFTRSKGDLAAQFWAETVQERRKKLFPFLWSEVAGKGQLYGNRTLGSFLNVSNPYWFSYPGYNEIFTGYPDTLVNSNDKIPNTNETVLGFLNRQSGFAGKVAAFTTWDVFPYILNEPVSGVYVNADTDTLGFSKPELKVVNDLAALSARPIGVRPDIFTYGAAREYLKAFHPRVLYIAFDETDDFAHGGLYDQYLLAAHAEDRMIADLWNTLQQDPVYKNKTTLIVTCDHGRGDAIKKQWRDHGQKVQDASEIWMAVIGPDTPPAGERKGPEQHYQQQLAASFARLLGFDFTSNHPVGKPIPELFK